MTAAITDVMSLERVLLAYKETGLSPTYGEWTNQSPDEDGDFDGDAEDTGPRCACPASAVACLGGLGLLEIAEAEFGEEDPADLIAEHLDLSPNGVIAFARGVDGESFSQVEDLLRRRVLKALEAAGVHSFYVSVEGARKAWEHGQFIRDELIERGLIEAASVDERRARRQQEEKP